MGAGPGIALDNGTRSVMEAGFGHDFSSVRVHADTGAAAHARTVNARAFTVGQDVFFAPGQYEPHSAIGRRLLAHELAHVTQRRDGWLQRTAYESCSSTRQPELRAAVDRADEQLGRARTALVAQSSSRRVRLALQLAFRDDSLQTKATAWQMLGTVRSGLSGATIECENEDEATYGLTCGGDRQAMVWTAFGYGIGHIHVCTGANEWGSLGDVQRTHLIIHEAMHRFGDVADRGYYAWQSDCTDTRNTMGLDTSQLLDNADSYACLVRHLLSATESELATRVDDRAGRTLILTQSPEGEIDITKGRRATETTFAIGIHRSSELTVLPGGFEVRWMIADDADNRYQMYGLGGPTHQYGTEAVVYIPSGTRALLRDSGIRHATVLCRVLIPHEGSRLFRLPVGFRY
jgi:hypothetical protein